MLLEVVLKILSLKMNFSGNTQYVNTSTVNIPLIFIIEIATNAMFQDKFFETKDT